MEWFPPPFSLQDGMHEWSKVPNRPHERGKGLLEPSTLTTKLDVVWRVREEMIEGPQADTGGGKRAASRPQVAQESLQGHPKVTSHVMDVTPKAENTFEVASSE